jgi:iron uptake system EfeUOB component EfeO/EfeM
VQTIKFTQNIHISMKLTTVKASSLLTVLCLSAALITSCGKKTETTTESTTSTTTTPAATTPAATTPSATTPAAGAGAPLSAAEKTQLTPVKTALVMANTAVKTGDMTKAKAQFDKFSSAWTTVEPMVKAKAGANYPMISSGIEMVKTAMSGATPDKAKAGEGLTTAIKAIDAVMNKK